jgi:hypothetical protein
MPATTTASETTLTPLQLQVLGYLADGASMVDITGVTATPSQTGAITTPPSPANS